MFSNTIDVSVTGALGANSGAYILFDGLQMGASQDENMYLDQQNEVVICAANCYFFDAWKNATTGYASLEIGPDASNMQSATMPVVLELNRGAFNKNDKGGATSDIHFDNTGGVECNCRIALGGGMTSLVSGTGIPSNNDPTRMLGQTTYAPPTFANAASVGVPLTLNPNELGVGVSTDTEIAPGKVGVKLRVECATNKNGKVKVLLLTGQSSNPVTLFDNIGDAGSVPECNQ